MSNTIHDYNEPVRDWRRALRYLEEGNRRYCEGRTAVRNVGAEERRALTEGQNPFAMVVTCSDSRVAPEVFFDQSVGDIFVARNAGNIANVTVLGAIEFAVGFLNVPLVVVVGHSCCAAVINAFNGGTYSENLQTVMEKIRPAITHCENEEEAIHANLDYVVSQIKENAVVKQAGAMVIGAFYDIASGEVVFTT